MRPAALFWKAGFGRHLDMYLLRITVCTLGIIAGLGCAMAASDAAAPVSDEPTREDCHAAVAEARALAAALPADHLSRYFAERHLHQALVEAGNGEFDECIDMAARASDEVRERRHELRPGEKLKVLGPHE
ncbi:hypothetical protein M2175_004070 [Bradyrhizobium elkanii]|uniref:Uncharacterized protein n=1 Tax=Bradyrhizobium japonicum TaxID=375 RepID=A0A1L3FCS9_BRAJP|nr:MULTISPECIES: hypothetical protein [Bradyrhizobium]APG11100.1 hypothetical protein BKD09_22475 [Bradyrhizobium japonicum]MCS3929039.1 hypothetical protein [Bradyrhizobium elkanii]MCS3969595.1 hypothetical protein [Bradyrhizobium japonicum]